MICINPLAPADETEFGKNELSHAATAASTGSGTPVRLAARENNEKNGFGSFK
ncbi:MAG: hypothetical protein QF389_07785 [Planctomycetota bacterium]|jgi:hypothetical protein|nr:hypothetical protein [Planctomycetota bacterium]